MEFRGTVIMHGLLPGVPPLVLWTKKTKQGSWTTASDLLPPDTGEHWPQQEQPGVVKEAQDAGG